ncbi:MAG: glycosyltransferase [Trichlorobacter sp.]|uniref:glycosyltransferase n=1 Tax=Trichlorobacter sp. TaxID=2911007 RepID=UPI0025666F85|nr:glycosyltransferase [Trichlorobacter sp.]MDK9719227.1 glycosyltransferase [Trichlorobacter sp.]
MIRLARKLIERLGRRRTLENVCHSTHTPRCLLCYVVAPFLHGGEPNPAHQNQWQAREMARIVDSMGYCVDVINYDNLKPSLRHGYDLLIDIHPGFDRPYLPYLNQGCRKIAYITGSNPVVANRAESDRLDDLFARRGVRLAPRRQSAPFPPEVLERFNAFCLIGNKQTQDTYHDFHLPRTFLLPNTGISGMAPEDTKRSPLNFMFLASGGQVHKGLDLLLEIFPRHPELHLYVCSSFKGEQDFCELYCTELFNTPNIHSVGFLDITSSRFRDIANCCAWMLLPSCAEGMSGSVTAAMSVGLVPVVSKACGFDADDATVLPDCRIKTIENMVVELSRKTAQQLAEQSRRAVMIVEQQYALECYSRLFRQALEETLHAM